MSTPPALTVLVVDDDPNLVRMLRRGLVLAGYDVLAAEDGEAALSALRDTPPDLLVLDVMLPEPLDGSPSPAACELRHAASRPPAS